MKISIITATNNSNKHIFKVLDCIQQQTYSDIEYLVIDGNSIDGTLDILQKSDLISHLVSEPDRGIYDALNKGINIATGELIGFLHSDDWFASPDTIANIVRAFATPTAENGKLPDIVYGDLVFVDQQDTNKVVRYWKSQPFAPYLLHRGWMPPHPTVFMRREVYEKHGRFNINLKCAADYDYILRVFRDQTLTKTYLPEVITQMRMGGMSTGGLKNLINKKKEDYWVLKNNRMPNPLWILFAKNISKIPQLIFKKKLEH